MENRRRLVKGNVRDNAEWLSRQRHLHRIPVNDIDIRPTTAEPLGQGGVELDGDDPPRDARQLGGQASGTRPEVDDEIVPADAGIRDELRSERA